MRRAGHTTGTLSVLGGLLSLAACSGDGGPEQGAAGLQRPNILWITIDTLRADHLGCYGYFRDTSPRIDALAEESVLFENCTVPMATTLPSHVSMLTGTWPIEHGVLANVAHGGKAFAPSPGLVSFAEVLTDCGYDTAAFISAKPLRLGAGVDSGFKTFDDPGVRERRGRLTINGAMEWLGTHESERAEDPFFLWVHLFDPHEPYGAPPRFADAFKTGDGLDEFLDTREIGDVKPDRGRQATDRHLSHNAYDAEILCTDFHIGRMLDELKQRGLQEDTVIMVLSDHGEALGQHGIHGHGRVWQEQVAAAFLLRVPGVAPRRVRQGVSSIDAFPTLLGRVQIPGTEAFLEQCSGVDVLAPGFEGRLSFSQITMRRVKDGEDNVFTVTKGKWKFHRLGSEGVALYDLEADPHELNDVATKFPDVVADLTGELGEILAGQADRSKELGRGELYSLDPETLKALEELGYTGSDEDE